VPVALATGHVHHVRAPRSGGRFQRYKPPRGAGTSSSRAGTSGQGVAASPVSSSGRHAPRAGGAARAPWRSPAGQVLGSWVGFPPPHAAPKRSGQAKRALPRTSPPPTTTTSGASPYGETGQAQVVGKASARQLGRGPEHFDRALEIGAGTGYFSLNLLPRRAWVGEAVAHRHLPRHAAGPPGLGGQAGGRGRDRSLRGRLPCPFEDEVLRPSCFGHAVLHPPARPRGSLPASFRRVLRPGAARVGVSCGEAVALWRPHRRAAQAGGAPSRCRRFWRAAMRAAPAQRRQRRSRHRGGPNSSRWWTCNAFHAARAQPPMPGAAGLRPGSHSGRGAGRQPVSAGPTRALEATADPRRGGRFAWRAVRPIAATCCSRPWDRAAARAPFCRRRSSTTC